MIGPVAKSGPAPAAAAAAFLVTGIFLGAWSVSGERLAVLSVALCGAVLAAAAASDRSLRGRELAPRHGKARILHRAAFLMFWLAAGFAWGRVRIAEPSNRARQTFMRIPADRDRADRIRGVVSDFWGGNPPRVHGHIRAKQLLVNGTWQPFPAEILVFVSGAQSIDSVADRGDRVEMVGHLTAEGPPVSPRDITTPWPVYRLSVKSAALAARRGRTVVSVLTAGNRWLYGRLPVFGARGPAFDSDVRGPLAALLLGRTADLERGMVARFRRGGLYHLLVVSGLHVALAVSLLFWCLRAMHVRGKKRDAALLMGLVVFVLLCGANPPALRAGLVLGISLVARLLERPIRSLQAIGLSAWALAAFVPAEIWSVGTVLTYAAALGICFFFEPIRNLMPLRPASIFAPFAAALSAQASTAPVLLWRFNLVSTGAWLTAPLCVPIVGAWMVLGGALLLCFAGGLFPAPLVALFGLLTRGLAIVADGGSSVALLRPTPPLPIVIAVGLALLAAAWTVGRRRALFASLAAATMLFLAVRRGPSGPASGFSIEALDVGQGDALLLRWGRRSVLIDGGGPFDRDARDFGRTHLLPKLLDRGVTKLDAAILTHPHPDHALGLFAVLEELPVGALFHSCGQDESNFFRDLDAGAIQRGIRPTVLQTGHVLRWADAEMRVIHSGGPRRKADATNNQSLVMLFTRHGRSVLLTGDAGAATEAALLREGRVPRADALKVGHHGSRGGTTPAFVAAVAPRAALLSCGRENRFGHPAPETLATLAAAHVPVFRTDLLSDVRLDLSPGPTRLCWRGLP